MFHYFFWLSVILFNLYALDAFIEMGVRSSIIRLHLYCLYDFSKVRVHFDMVEARLGPDVTL